MFGAKWKVMLVLVCLCCPGIGFAEATELAVQAEPAKPAESPAAAEQRDEDGWHFLFSPLHGWLVGIEGSAAVPALGGARSLDLDFSDPFGNLTGGVSFHFEGGKGPWTLIADYLFAGFGTETPGPLGVLTLSADVDMSLLEFAGAYRACKRPSYAIELLAGARRLGVSIKVSAENLPFSPDTSESVWDGFGGVRLTGRVSDKWRLSLRGDVGGGGSKLVWNVNLGADWRFKQWGSVQFGYRWLDYDIESGSEDSPFRYDVLAQGPYAGVALHW
jgi:hypothetical protein